MKIHLTRDSVAAGDDTDAPHSKIIDLPEITTLDSLEKLLNSIQQLQYLPSISNSHATWVLTSQFPLAIFAQQGATLKIIAPNFWLPIETIDKDFSFRKQQGIHRFHFSYLAQQDPEMIFSAFKRISYP